MTAKDNISRDNSNILRLSRRYLIDCESLDIFSMCILENWQEILLILLIVSMDVYLFFFSFVKITGFSDPNFQRRESDQKLNIRKTFVTDEPRSITKEKYKLQRVYGKINSLLLLMEDSRKLEKRSIK